MNNAPQWLLDAKTLGLDPDELRRVSERYDMHCSYNAEMGAEILPIERWYHWYRIEKVSEGHGMSQPPAQGCSVSEAAPAELPAGEVVSEQDFLRLLLSFRDWKTPK